MTTSPSVDSQPKRYHPVLVAMHWLTLLFIIVAYFLRSGEGRNEGGASSIFGLQPLAIHMIAGAFIFVFLLVRLIIRIRSKHPAWASTGNAFFDKIGELTHWALYVFMFGILIAGLVTGLQGNRIARTFGVGGASQFQPGGQGQFQPGQFPPNDGGNFQPGQFPPRGGGDGFGRGNPLFILGRLHGLLFDGLFLLVLLHVGAALYHQFFLKDNLLSRMSFGGKTS